MTNIVIGLGGIILLAVCCVCCFLSLDGECCEICAQDDDTSDADNSNEGEVVSNPMKV